MKIVDLVKQMIRLSGFRLAADKSAGDSAGDIVIYCTRLRPRDKLYEE